jgi:hypothetical protein
VGFEGVIEYPLDSTRFRQGRSQGEAEEGPGFQPHAARRAEGVDPLGWRDGDSPQTQAADEITDQIGHEPP